MSRLQKKFLILLGIVIVDSLFTIYLVMHGNEEANPMLSFYMQYVGVVGMAITKIVVSTVLLIGVYKLDLREFTDKCLSWGIAAYLIIFTVSFSGQFLIY